MNWLEHARREIRVSRGDHPAKRAKGNLTALLAVPDPSVRERTGAQAVDDAGLQAFHARDDEAVLEAFEERAALVECEGGVSRADAERLARVVASRSQAELFPPPTIPDGPIAAFSAPGKRAEGEGEP